MTISVVVPCRNAEPYLAQTIGSAIDQHRPPDEIIVVDDGSTDGSLAIARRLAAAAPVDIRVIQTAFANGSRTRNAGAALARGDALLFLDADDVLGKGAISALASALGREPAGLALCPWLRLVLDEGRWVSAPASCRPRHPGQDPLSGWLTGWYHPPCSVLWSRDAFERAGRWDERTLVNQDGDLVMRALIAGARTVETSEGAAYYRRQPDGASVSSRRNTRRGLESRLRVIRKVGYLLTEGRRLSSYRAELAAAFRAIAHDARVEHPDITARADALARHYQPRFARRMISAVIRTAASRAAEKQSGIEREQREVIEGLDLGAMLLTPDRTEAHAAASDPALPAVSVIIPTFNRARLLERAVRSVLEGTFQDVEVLVVDDGSTDETAAVIARFGDGRIRYLMQPRNLGVGAARNRGIRESRGEFIAFLDSDDEWTPEKLQRQVELLRADEHLGLVYTRVETLAPSGERRESRSCVSGDVFRSMLHHNVIHGGGSNAVIRRSVVATAGFFREDLPAIEDHEYWLRITRFYPVGVVDAALVRYHDVSPADRRSRVFQTNIAARRWLFRRYAAEMRRHGAAHLFLARTASWSLRAGVSDRTRPAAWAVRAVLDRPWSRIAWGTLWEVCCSARSRGRSADVPCRILLFSTVQPGHRGGVQGVMRALHAQLRARGSGYDVRLGWSNPPTGGSDHEVYIPLPYFSTAQGVVTLRSTVGGLRRMIRLGWTLARLRLDVVNVHYATPECLWLIRLAPLLRYRVVLSIHGSDVLRRRSEDTRWLQRAVTRADAITTVSTSTREAVLRLGGADAAVRLIPNGVDLDFWRERSTGDAEPHLILTVGRLHAVKGQDLLLRAFARVRERIGDAKLVIIGAGGSEAKLRRLQADLGLDTAVVFAGELGPEEVRRWLWRARVFVLASRSEGMPLTILEAMASGVPVIATAVGGVPGLLSDGAGVLVPAEDTEALAGAIGELLTHVDASATLIEKARARVETFSASTTAADYAALFSLFMVERGPIDVSSRCAPSDAMVRS